MGDVADLLPFHKSTLVRRIVQNAHQENRLRLVRQQKIVACKTRVAAFRSKKSDNGIRPSQEAEYCATKLYQHLDHLVRFDATRKPRRQDLQVTIRRHRSVLPESTQCRQLQRPV